jgi:hypothetical protein
MLRKMAMPFLSHLRELDLVAIRIDAKADARYFR